MIIVPLKAIASQTLSVVLAGQAVQINLYSKFSILYMDVYLNNSPVILGVQCQNCNRIIRDAYLGFSGDFVFNDTQGSDDPLYTGLGARWLLVYFDTSDLTTLGFAA